MKRSSRKEEKELGLVLSFIFVFIWGGEFTTLCRISGHPGVGDGAVQLSVILLL